MKKSDKYISCVKQVCGQNAKITTPAIAEKNHPVYIAETDKKKTVFRFSSQECANANEYSSTLLNRYGIKVPKITVQELNGKYCEIYPYMDGVTLREKLIKKDISKDGLHYVFKQLIDLSVKIADIPIQDGGVFYPQNSRIALLNVFFQAVQPSVSPLCHTDLSLTNVLLDADNNIVGLLDLDGVSMAHFNTMFARICFCAKQCGLNVKDFYNMYPKKYLDASLMLLGLKKQISTYVFLMEKNTKIIMLQSQIKQSLANKFLVR